MSDVLLVQNTRIEGSGTLGALLDADGFKTKSVFAKEQPLPSENFSLLVILGAPESANDDLAYLKEEQKLIQKYVDAQKPVLGICLGSQLIAKAFGGNVYAGPKKEIGFFHDLQIDGSSKLFSGFKNPFTVFHWHGDTFDLPPNAVRLAHSTNYKNQAFQIGSAVGIQFHLEVDENMINLWLDKTEDKLENIPYIDPQKIRNEINSYASQVKNNMKLFYKNFKSEFNL